MSGVRVVVNGYNAKNDDNLAAWWFTGSMKC